MQITTGLLADHPTHLPIVAEWIFRQWAYKTPNSSLESVVDRLRSHLQRNALPLMVVAIDGVQCVGCASLRTSDLAGREDLSPWLASVYVPVERRRQGIGAALVQAVEAKAAMMGVAELYLFTPDRQNFYADLKWENYATETIGTNTVSVMRKRLQT